MTRETATRLQRWAVPVARILIVENDPVMCKLFRGHVENMNLRMEIAKDLDEARAAMAGELPGLVVLDRCVKPAAGVLGFCLALKRNLRSRRIPVIVLSDVDDIREEFKCYRFGADLFLSKKSESMRKLDGYIGAFLERLPCEEEPSDEIVCGDVSVDRRERVLRVGSRYYRGIPPRLFDLLHFIASRRGRLATREAVIKRLWKSPVRDRQVDVLVSRLKSLLGPEAAPIIESVRGVGYRLKAGTGVRPPEN
ncbi:MAG: response regulator transcription factor [Elusimicrobiota bacterium]